MDRPDRADMKILDLLQTDALLTNEQIGNQVNLEKSVICKRRGWLEDNDYILGYRAELNREQLAFGTTVITFVRLERHTEPILARFEEQIKGGFPNIIECLALYASWDYMLRTVVRDNLQYDHIHGQLLKLDNIQLLRTLFAKPRFSKPTLPLL